MWNKGIENTEKGYKTQFHVITKHFQRKIWNFISNNPFFFKNTKLFRNWVKSDILVGMCRHQRFSLVVYYYNLNCQGNA